MKDPEKSLEQTGETQAPAPNAEPEWRKGQGASTGDIPAPLGTPTPSDRPEGPQDPPPTSGTQDLQPGDPQSPEKPALTCEEIQKASRLTEPRDKVFSVQSPAQVLHQHSSLLQQKIAEQQ